MYERFVKRREEEALSDTPVVLIVGPRRAGKTTLVRKMGEAGRTYITLDGFFYAKVRKATWVVVTVQARNLSAGGEHNHS
jgi:uridine kinase